VWTNASGPNPTKNPGSYLDVPDQIVPGVSSTFVRTIRITACHAVRFCACFCVCICVFSHWVHAVMCEVNTMHTSDASSGSRWWREQIPPGANEYDTPHLPALKRSSHFLLASYLASVGLCRSLQCYHPRRIARCVCQGCS